MLTNGIPYSGESRLVACQGNALSISGLKEFRFIMPSVDGRTISFKEVGHLSSAVSCPLVSFGRLLRMDGGLVATAVILCLNIQVQELQLL